MPHISFSKISNKRYKLIAIYGFYLISLSRDEKKEKKISERKEKREIYQLIWEASYNINKSPTIIKLYFVENACCMFLLLRNESVYLLKKKIIHLSICDFFLK